MNQHPDYETWVVEAGDVIITKRARGVRLSPLERLVYCLWVADYGGVQEQIRIVSQFRTLMSHCPAYV